MIPTKTNDQFVAESKVKNNNLYDYSLTNYKNASTKVKIICNKHNCEFLQTPSQHLMGKVGCLKCRGEMAKKALSFTTEAFVEKANRIHNNEYDYSKSSYVGAGKKINIICKIHGSFSQKANDHLSGHKCSKCSYINKLNYNKETLKSLDNQKQIVDFYIFRFSSNDNEENFIKIGISKNLKERYQTNVVKSQYKLIEIIRYSCTLLEAYELERRILSDFRVTDLYIPIHKFPGYTECLKNSCLNKVIIEFNKTINERKKIRDQI